jgi:hypothetical protein
LRNPYRLRFITSWSSTSGQILRGLHFDGVIFMPAMLRERDVRYSPYGISDMWTPSPHLIIKAEKALPMAISRLVASHRKRINFPTYHTAKNGTNLAMGDESPDLVPDEESDSDFVSHVTSYLNKYKRQYIGLTIKGKKVLMINFFPDSSTFSDPTYLSDWKYHWVDVLDGSWGFWRVLYDPATQKFSDWQCNGEA